MDNQTDLLAQIKQLKDEKNKLLDLIDKERADKKGYLLISSSLAVTQ